MSPTVLSAAEALRDELRTWLAQSFPSELAKSTGPSGPDDELIELHRLWNGRLFDAGYATAAWPEAFGGRNASVHEQLVVIEELDRVGAPAHINTIGLQNIGPSIMQWGTPEQQARHLRPMARSDEAVEAIAGALDTHTSLTISERRDLGPHYAATLACWRSSFMANWPTIASERFDPVFKRMWELYLAYSEAGFRSGYLGVSQFGLSRSAPTGR